MEAFYTYVAKVNIALGIFWLFYHFIFLRDSFIVLKRVCLLTVLFLSFSYPFIDFSLWVFQERQLFWINYIPDLGRSRNCICNSYRKRNKWGPYFRIYLWYRGCYFRDSLRHSILSDLSFYPEREGIY